MAPPCASASGWENAIPGIAGAFARCCQLEGKDSSTLPAEAELPKLVPELLEPPPSKRPRATARTAAPSTASTNLPPPADVFAAVSAGVRGALSAGARAGDSAVCSPAAPGIVAAAPAMRVAPESAPAPTPAIRVAPESLPAGIPGARVGDPTVGLRRVCAEPAGAEPSGAAPSARRAISISSPAEAGRSAVSLAIPRAITSSIAAGRSARSSVRRGGGSERCASSTRSSVAFT